MDGDMDIDMAMDTDMGIDSWNNHLQKINVDESINIYK
jgi:hypothetical protein